MQTNIGRLNAVLDTDHIWAFIGSMERVMVAQGQTLQPNKRNFIARNATEIYWPDVANLVPNTIFTVYRGAMVATPDIVGSTTTLTVLDNGQAYGDGIGQHECRVPYGKYVETVYLYNGSFIQELPTTAAYDNLTGTLYEMTFTSSGSFIVPQSNNLKITLVGGGGAGASLTWYGGCGGGGGGAIVDHIMTLPAGESVPITIGAGGISNGADGGDTSFGAYLIAQGGKSALSASYTAANIGLGGSYSGTETITTGVDGGDGGVGGFANHDANTAGDGTKGQDVTSSLDIFFGGDGGVWARHPTSSDEYGGGGGGGATGCSNGGKGANGLTSGNDGVDGSGGGGNGGGSTGGKGGNGFVKVQWGQKGGA